MTPALLSRVATLCRRLAVYLFKGDILSVTARSRRA